MFSWNSLAFSMIHRILAIWSLVPLPFLNQLEYLEVHGSCTVEAWLGELWALLYWCMRWVQLCSSLSILWHCLSLGLEWKLTFSSPVATAEFSKLASMLSAALSQHHFLGFETAPVNSITSASFVHSVASKSPLDFIFQDVWLYVSSSMWACLLV